MKLWDKAERLWTRVKNWKTVRGWHIWKLKLVDEDPVMLYSFINMKLRDFYPSLDALCEDMNVEKEDIVRKLKLVGFEYNPAKNRFW